MREECGAFAEKLTGLFSNIILRTMTVEPLRQWAEDLTLSQVQTLTLVAERDVCSIGEIADGLGVSHPAAVRLVDRLVRKELLLRGVSAADQRQAEIRATPEARQLVNDIRLERAVRLEEVLDRMSEAERAALMCGLESFVTAALNDQQALDALCWSCQALLPTECEDFPGFPDVAADKNHPASAYRRAPLELRLEPIQLPRKAEV